jgi:deoxyribodipyrimidine photolyase-related protein
MKQIKSALLLYPNQLFSVNLLPKADVIYLVEEPLFFGRDTSRPLNMHQQKLILHRASMRRYIEEVLWPNDINVEYIELKDIEFTADVLVRAQQAGAEVVMLFDPTDNLIESRLKKAMDETVQTPFELRILPNPSFMLKRTEVRDYFATKGQHHFADFYQWQRERFNILIDDNYRPVGNKWMLDAPRQVLQPDQVAPGFKAYGDNDYVTEAKKWVQEYFGGNPGSASEFFWPTSHAEASAWLNDFISGRLDSYANFKDELEPGAIMLFRSGVAAMLNCGLLTPLQIIDALLAAHRHDPIALPSLELFIRNIIGKREYVRGLYVTQTFEPKALAGQTRPLSAQWYNAATGLLPLDSVIIDPQNMYDWFASLLVDSYDWVVAPYVYGTAQLSDLGGLYNVPYISGASHILAVSHYQKDLWCDIWDGLFWAFIDKHETALKNNPHFKTVLEHLEKITPEHRRIIGYRAQDFLTSIS